MHSLSTADARRRRLLLGSAAATVTSTMPRWARAADGWPAMSAEDQVPMDPCLAYTPGSSESPWLPQDDLPGTRADASPSDPAEARQRVTGVSRPASARTGVEEASPAARPLVSDWRELLLRRDRGIWLRRPATREEIRVVYWTPSTGYLRDGFRDVCDLMRDVRAGQSASIDPALVDLLYGTQAWLAHYRINAPIDILSGYRTQATNASLEGAAKNSFHLQGRAADITIPTVSKETLGAMFRQFGAGGVGFYVSRGFIHADTGPERTWGLARR